MRKNPIESVRPERAVATSLPHVVDHDEVGLLTEELRELDRAVRSGECVVLHLLRGSCLFSSASLSCCATRCSSRRSIPETTSVLVGFMGSFLQRQGDLCCVGRARCSGVKSTPLVPCNRNRVRRTPGRGLYFRAPACRRGPYPPTRRGLVLTHRGALCRAAYAGAFVGILAAGGCGPAPGATAAQAPTFESHWQDGKAELDGYRYSVTRYGEKRRGTAVMVFVTEPFSESKAVKVDDPSVNPADTFEALKLNLIRDFQTGIYDYNTMVSLFVKSRDFSPVKISFSSAEWCGHVYEEMIFSPNAIADRLPAISRANRREAAAGSKRRPYRNRRRGAVRASARPEGPVA